MDPQDPLKPSSKDPPFSGIDPRASLFVKIEEGDEEIVTDPKTGQLLNDEKTIKRRFNETPNFPSVSIFRIFHEEVGLQGIVHY